MESLRAASVYQVEAFVALSFAVMDASREALYFVDLLKSRELFKVDLVLVWTPSRLRRLMRVPVSSSVVSSEPEEDESSLSEGGGAGRLRIAVALGARFLKAGRGSSGEAMVVLGWGSCGVVWVVVLDFTNRRRSSRSQDVDKADKVLGCRHADQSPFKHVMQHSLH